MGTPIPGLMEEIESCRNEMVRIASETSLANQLVLETSRRLDHLLNKLYQFKK
ncbi:aspartyl-phosphate phosphatase Spo0E family protein [Neobacillus sp. WH10]|uniref:aspartyl-phosphate phosphatase Spo0E family protein n=1 Tax=Neobacillus sp. WH10 TaxID=3047873 RepID=UPI0024C1A09F|nr:aspartyl-phosphate phosphatase Spo0E family protein [Neobacillus sp. WH10]WHY77795.1 aspartyl-phosphate phosphatase Spo0E family protein [Neobacillus sp. WH10]